MALALAAPVNGSSNSTVSRSKTILLTNDDGFTATNIRATYRELKAAGYNVIMVAPVSQRSGYSGKFDLPTTANLTTDGEFGYVKKGSPSWGHEEDDKNIWYFNGTPGSSVAFALNYVIPTFFNNVSVDLTVAGPNEGTNLGIGMYTISGTIGATYNSVYRGIPGIAFSGSNGNNSFFKDYEAQANDANFSSNIYAKKVVEFVDQLYKGAANNTSLLPEGTGINVNLPLVGSDNSSCTDPNWIHTRFSGPDSTASDLFYNKTSGLVEYQSGHLAALNTFTFGDKTLPGESHILASNNCESSVTVFSIDYDASLAQTNAVGELLQPIFSTSTRFTPTQPSWWKF